LRSIEKTIESTGYALKKKIVLKRLSLAFLG